MELRSGRITGTQEQKISLVSKIIAEHIKRAGAHDDVKEKISCIADLYVFCSGPLFEQVGHHFERIRAMLMKKSVEYERDMNRMIDTQRLLPTDTAYIRLTQSIATLFKKKCKQNTF